MKNIRNQAVAQVYDKKVLVNKQKVDRSPYQLTQLHILHN